MNLIAESIKYICDTHREKKHMIITLGKEKSKQQTLRTTLGIGWIIIRDIIYFTVYVMFRFLMSGSRDVEGMNYILYILLGIIPWNFMREVLNGGVTSIKSNKSILSSISFPVCIFPTVEVVGIFIKRLFTLLILIVVIFFFGEIQNVTWWILIYYFLSMFVLMLVWNSIFSPIIAVSNDFEQLYKALMSVVMYTLPIMWSFERIGTNSILAYILRANPLVYIIDGFRLACRVDHLPSFYYTAYFWGLCLIMFVLGAVLQNKLRRHYIDLI